MKNDSIWPFKVLFKVAATMSALLKSSSTACCFSRWVSFLVVNAFSIPLAWSRLFISSLIFLVTNFRSSSLVLGFSNFSPIFLMRLFDSSIWSFSDSGFWPLFWVLARCCSLRKSRLTERTSGCITLGRPILIRLKLKRPSAFSFFRQLSNFLTISSTAALEGAVSKIRGSGSPGK